jgi:hypothetical protein
MNQKEGGPRYSGMVECIQKTVRAEGVVSWPTPSACTNEVVFFSHASATKTCLRIWRLRKV